MNKREVASHILSKGTLYIHLDPRKAGVSVPPWLTHQEQLVLHVGYDMPIPIPDLSLDSDGLVGTLSFSRTPYTCVVSWSAVFALVGDDGLGMVWPEDMPPGVAAEAAIEAAAKAAAEAGAKVTKILTKKKLPAGWAVIEGGKPATKEAS